MENGLLGRDTRGRPFYTAGKVRTDNAGQFYTEGVSRFAGRSSKNQSSTTTSETEILALPVGEKVDILPNPGVPRRMHYEGQFVILSPLDPAADFQRLYACSHGTEERERLWTYLGYGPFADANAMRQWLIHCSKSADPLFFAVRDRELDAPVGMVSFLNIVPEARRVELGHIWYSPDAQRTKANTEAVYLMLCETFDELSYRRAEWKCDSLNQRSRWAALRLGFRYEGLFRQHLVVKGRNRDTAWFSMLDSEWPAIKSNMELWLYRNEDRAHSLRALNAEAGNVRQ